MLFFLFSCTSKQEIAFYRSQAQSEVSKKECLNKPNLEISGLNSGAKIILHGDIVKKCGSRAIKQHKNQWVEVAKSATGFLSGSTAAIIAREGFRALSKSKTGDVTTTNVNTTNKTNSSNESVNIKDSSVAGGDIKNSSDNQTATTTDIVTETTTTTDTVTETTTTDNSYESNINDE